MAQNPCYRSKVFYDEIKKVENAAPLSIDNLGLIASDIRVDFDVDNKNYVYFLYDRSFILKKEDEEIYFTFNYGNIWYEKFEEELRELLDKNPRYFLDK